MNSDRILEVASMRSANSHWPPNKLWIMSQFEIELGCGAEACEENVLKVDEGGPEDAGVEGGDQGAGEDVAGSAQERGEDVQWVECGWEVPFT